VEELVTRRLPRVARPELLKIVLQRFVLKKLVEVASVVVAFETVRLVIVDEALMTVPATCAKATEESCCRGERVSKLVPFEETSTFKKTFVLEKS